MKKLSLLILPFLLFQVYAQTTNQWLNYSYSQRITSISENLNNIWLGTYGGLIQIDRRTGEKIICNRGNSDLPGNYINHLFYDSQQRLWISTQHGLAKLEQNRLTRVNDTISGSISQGQNGKIWVASNQGLYRLNGEEVAYFRYPFWAVFNTHLCYDQQENVLWGTAYTFGYFAVFRFDGTNWDVYDQSNSALPFESPQPNPLAFDEEGRLWVGTWSGLFRYDGDSTWTRAETSGSGLPDGQILSMAADQHGHLWLSHRQGFGKPLQMFIREEGIWKEKPLPDNLYSVDILFPSQIADERWIYDQVHGLYYSSNQEWEKYNAAFTPFRPDRIQNMAFDKVNEQVFLLEQPYNNIPARIWTLSNNLWQELAVPDIQVSQFAGIREIQIDPQGRIWLVWWDEGVFIRENDRWTRWQPNNSSIDPKLIDHITFADDGTIWAIQDGRQVFTYRDNFFRMYGPNDHGITSGSSGRLAIHTVTGDIWFRSYIGFARFDGNSWETHTSWNGKNIQPSGIAFNADGSVWIGSREGLLKYDGGMISQLDPGNSGLPEGWIGNVLTDEQGTLWVGTDHALASYDGTSWQTYDRYNSGYPGERTYQMLQDAQENLWMLGWTNLTIFNQDGLAVDTFLHTPNAGLPTTFTIYPNPVIREGIATLYSADFLFDQIEILDASGRLIFQQSFQASLNFFQLPVERLPWSPGMYLVRIIGGENAMTRKLVLE